MASAHLELLKTLCRLCGSDKAIPNDRAPKKKADFYSWILKALSIDVSQDTKEKHPEFVCHCCALKLQRWKKKDNKSQKTDLNINLKEYKAHSENCSLCTEHNVSSAEEPSGSTEKPTVIQDCILTNSKQFGLVSWMYGSTCYSIQVNTCGTCLMKRMFVNQNSEWGLDILGHEIDKIEMKDFLVPEKLSSETDVYKLLTCVRDISICEGNHDIFTDEECNHLKKENLLVENFIYMDSSTVKTIRHRRCKHVSNSGTHCSVCTQYRNDLFSKRSRMRVKTKSDVTLSSHSRNDLLTSAEKGAKLKLMAHKQKHLKGRLSHLEERITKLFSQEVVALGDEESAIMKKIFMSEEDSIRPYMVPGSPQHLLWEQQKSNLTKPSNRWRWHPDILKWCVAIHAKSPAAYNLLRQSGLLTLPSLRTINKYVHFCKAGVGFTLEILKHVAEEIAAPLGDIKENVTLVLDEMKIKSGLVFSGSSGRLVGFTDTGSINNMLNDFERRINDEQDSKTLPLASHVLVLMVRTIFASIKSPVAYFATHDLKGDDLYPIVWECVRHLELFNLHVRAIVCDGASQNRKFFNIHENSDGLTYFTDNPFRVGERIYFFCDAPHLLKTTRNNWENSGYNSKSRNLKFQGKEIRWSHLMALQEWDQQLNAASPGLRFVYKLTHEHINLTPAARMRVYLAAQVLSNTVANAIESMGKEEMSSTVYFIRKINKWFDCLNVANTTQHILGRNPNLAPYRTVDDKRFKWLEEFIAFLDEWNEEVQTSTDVPKKERSRLFLSRETYTGHKLTVKSFVSLAKELLQTPGVDYILSEKFSQDPLEEYFSKQRGCGGRNENPTLEQFGHNVLSLMVAGSKALSSMKGNCRKRPREEEEAGPSSNQFPK